MGKIPSNYFDTYPTVKVVLLMIIGIGVLTGLSYLILPLFQDYYIYTCDDDPLQWECLVSWLLMT